MIATEPRPCTANVDLAEAPCVARGTLVANLDLDSLLNDSEARTILAFPGTMFVGEPRKSPPERNRTHNDAMTESADSNVRIVRPDQARELLALRRSALEHASMSSATRDILSAIAKIVGTKVAIVDRDGGGTWNVRAESAVPSPLT